MWMNNLGQNWPITMQTPTTNWQYISQSSYSDSGYSLPTNLTSAATNTTYYLELTLENTSGVTWSNSGNTPFRLGVPNNASSPFCNGTWIGTACNRAAVLTQSSVAPGQTGTFEFSITTPASPINTRLYLIPVMDGVTWMNDIGLYWPIVT